MEEREVEDSVLNPCELIEFFFPNHIMEERWLVVAEPGFNLSGGTSNVCF